MNQVNSAFAELLQNFARVGHINAAQQTLFWETRTTMPAGGAATRGTVLSTLTGIAAEAMADPRMGDLLDRAEGEEAEALDPWEAANLREMRRRWRHETAIPVTLASRIAAHNSTAQSVWDKALREDDFASFEPCLQQSWELQREVAAIKSDTFGVAPYDAMLDLYEAGLTAATVDPIFDDLAQFLPALLQRILDKRAGEPAPLKLQGPFSVERQMELSRKLAGMIGFDFEHGRIDTTVHPFASGVPGDVRITTRFDPEDLMSGIMATIHETGHAMYEAGLPGEWAFQPVGEARGAAMHESQSLLMEMQAGRNAAFLPVLGTMLREHFGDGGPAWGDGNILRLYRRVGPSPIRVDADEVTYPLHVILRYRIERMVLAGELRAGDLPDVWRQMMLELVGIAPENDRQGCLQDIHWAAGLLGYFPTYSIGAVMAAQFFAAATQQDPTILAGLGKGDFRPLLAWTGANIHSQGSSAPDSEAIMLAATGAPLSTEAFKAHLAKRYLEE